MSSNYSAPETFEKLKTVFEQDADLKKMDSSYTCQFNDNNCTGTAKGSKFSADMKVTDAGSQSELNLNIEIPFMLSPFKGVIKDTLEKKLNKALS